MVPDGTLYFTATVKTTSGSRHSLWCYKSTIPNAYVPATDAAKLVMISGETRNPYGMVTGPVLDLLALGDRADSLSRAHGRVDATTGDIPINYRVRDTSKVYDVVATVNGTTVTTQLASASPVGIPLGALPTFTSAFSASDISANSENLVFRKSSLELVSNVLYIS